MSDNIKYGRIGWIDLTVPDADKIRDFYSKVTGWEPSPVSMGEYNDYIMTPEGESDAAAGICHSQGVNANLPPYWMIYINVKDIDQSVSDCVKLGGSIVTDIKKMGNYGRYAVIQDPAGAYCSLFEPVKE